MKRNSKIGLYLCAGLLMFSSCAKDDGPSIDDYFLNYEIPDVEPPAGLQLGAYYMNLGSGGLNAEKYARLKQPLDYANSILGANVIPMLSSVNYPEEGSKATDAPYPMNPNNEEFIAIAQQQVDWALQAGLDFFILPNCNTSMGKYPNVLGDTAFVNVVTGRRDVTGKAANDPACGALVDLKGLKYVISVNMNNFNNQPTALKAEEGGRVEEVQDVVSTRPLKYQTRLQRFNDIFKRIADYFSDPNYFKVDGKPMVVIIAADKTHSLDSKKLYADMRAYVKEERGYDMFLVARQGAFTPPGRYQYYFVGNVDALCCETMYKQTNYNRSQMYPQLIDQNWAYFQSFLSSNFGHEFIPTVSPAFNWYVENLQNYAQYPLVVRNKDTFKTLCNVAKRNLGRHPIVFVDSFNDWNTNTAIEPTDPAYGDGYRPEYLDFVRAQFKR